MLSKIEKKGAGDSDFAAHLSKLRTAVLEHAQAEELTVFVPLARVLDREQLEKMGEQYDRVKSMAPTYPHPHAPSTPPGNVVLGPVALADRFRDAKRKAS